ncbi:MAG: FecR family protein [Bacteroidales bacterium]
MKQISIDHIIQLFFRKEATPAQLEELKQWFQENEENRLYFLKQKNIHDTTYPAFDPGSISSDEALSLVLQKIDLEECPKIHVGRFRKIYSPLLKIASIVLLAVVSTSLLIHLSQPTYIEVVAEIGKVTFIQLPDHSEIWLNSGSKLTYPEKFTGKIRKVQLQGEAYFKVQSDKTHPFIVQTSLLEVKATGTEFNVESFSSDSIIKVIMKEGKVEVYQNNNDCVKLNPGDCLTYNSNTQNAQITRVNVNGACSWKEGKLIFNNEKLGDILKRLGQLYDTEFVIDDPEISQYVYKAKFDQGSLTDILDMICLTMPLKYEASSSGNKIAITHLK